MRPGGRRQSDGVSMRSLTSCMFSSVSVRPLPGPPVTGVSGFPASPSLRLALVGAGGGGGQSIMDDLAAEEGPRKPLVVKQGVSSSSSSSSPSSSSIWVVSASTFVAVMGSYVFGCSVGFSSPAQAGIMDDLELSLAEYSVFGSVLTIGAMVGAIMSGKFADFMGRRSAMGLSSLFCIMGWFAIFFSKGSVLLDVGRLSVGYGIGLLSYVVPVYIAEITPKDIRGGFTAVHQLMICCGASLTFVIGTVLNWRTLALLGTAPCLVQILGLFFIPESPRWLAKMGRHQEFESTLHCLRGKDADISEEACEIKEYIESLQQLPHGRMLDLFQRRYLHPVIVGVGLMVLQQFGGVNGIAFYASSVFVSAGFASGSTGTVAMAAVQIPMTMLGVLLLDKSGRRPLLMVSAAGTCLGCCLAGMSFLLKGLEWSKELIAVLSLAGILIYTGSFSLGMGGIPWVIMSEIFPINMKGSAGSLVTLVSWMGSWIISYAFNFLMSWSSSGTFFIFSSICGLTVIFVARLVSETKGRTLEEIQASMVFFSDKP